MLRIDEEMWVIALFIQDDTERTYPKVPEIRERRSTKMYHPHGGKHFIKLEGCTHGF